MAPTTISLPPSRRIEKKRVGQKKKHGRMEMAPSPGPTTPRRTICKPRVSELAVGSRGRQCLGAQPAAPRRRPRGCPLLAGRATATTGQAASPEIPRATTTFMINSRFLDRARWHALSPSEARGAQKALPSPGSQGGCDMQQASIMCLSTRRARLPSSGSVIMQPWGWEGRGGLRETTHPSSWASSNGFADTFVNMGWDDDDDEW